MSHIRKNIQQAKEYESYKNPGALSIIVEEPIITCEDKSSTTALLSIPQTSSLLCNSRVLTKTGSTELANKKLPDKLHKARILDKVYKLAETLNYSEIAIANQQTGVLRTMVAVRQFTT